MTNQEAIKELQKGMPTFDATDEECERYVEAYNMAIKALEQEPCEDCISRERLKKCFHKNIVGAKVFDEIIDMQPSVYPKQQNKVGVRTDVTTTHKGKPLRYAEKGLHNKLKGE